MRVIAQFNEKAIKQDDEGRLVLYSDSTYTIDDIPHPLEVCHGVVEEDMAGLILNAVYLASKVSYSEKEYGNYMKEDYWLYEGTNGMWAYTMGPHLTPVYCGFNSKDDARLAVQIRIDKWDGIEF